MKKRRRKPYLNRLYQTDPEVAFMIRSRPRYSRPRSVADTFCRINNRARTCNARHFRQAGYPSAILSASGHLKWSEVHQWCQATYGDQYSWTGSIFWFQTVADRDKFVAKFNLEIADENQAG